MGAGPSFILSTSIAAVLSSYFTESNFNKIKGLKDKRTTLIGKGQSFIWIEEAACFCIYGPFGSHLTVPRTWWTFFGLFMIHWHWAPNWSIMPVLAHVWTLVDPLGTLLDHKKNPHHLFGFHSHKTMKKGNGYPFVVHTGQYWISIQSFESLLWTLLDHGYRTIVIPMIFFQGLKVLVKLILV